MYLDRRAIKIEMIDDNVPFLFTYNCLVRQIFTDLDQFCHNILMWGDWGISPVLDNEKGTCQCVNGRIPKRHYYFILSDSMITIQSISAWGSNWWELLHYSDLFITYELSIEAAHKLWACSSFFIDSQRSVVVIRLLITVCDTSLCIMNNWIGRLVVR